jgi:7-carboxy-7-deazaguanine synthase (Cx14CxxC type)
VSYAVKEVYFTLQGEGHHTGRPAVFLRFAGCNLWSGREADRATAVCRFCDTDFVGTGGPGGGRYAAEELASRVAATWDAAVREARFVVCTGGEPLLQLDEPLLAALHARGFTVAIETNGTIPVPPGVDWVCVSPKVGADLAVTAGDELKLVHPQERADPERYEDLAFTHFFLQPMDGPDRERNTELVRAYASTHPRWKVSLQTHKLLGIP